MTLRRKQIATLAKVFLFVGLPLAYFLFAWEYLRDSRELVNSPPDCRSCMKQLALALKHYHEVEASYPPAHFGNIDGKPTHSWRVLILPYIGKSNIYEHYNFSKPWNEQDDDELKRQVPRCYLCLESQIRDELKDGKTSYFTLVDSSDRQHKILCLIESYEHQCHWLEPRDIVLDELAKHVNDKGKLCLANPHDSCLRVAYLNGAVREYENGLTLNELLAAIEEEKPFKARPAE